MKKVIIIAVIVIFICVGFQPVMSIEIKDTSIDSKVDFKQNNYDLTIMFAFIYGEVKNVRFQYHDYKWCLYFDIINVTITGFFHWDWNEYYYATYKLDENNCALHVNYFGINKLTAYHYPHTVNKLYGIAIDGQIVR